MAFRQAVCVFRRALFSKISWTVSHMIRVPAVWLSSSLWLCVFVQELSSILHTQIFFSFWWVLVLCPNEFLLPSVTSETLLVKKWMVGKNKHIVLCLSFICLFVFSFLLGCTKAKSVREESWIISINGAQSKIWMASLLWQIT